MRGSHVNWGIERAPVDWRGAHILGTPIASAAVRASMCVMLLGHIASAQDNPSVPAAHGSRPDSVADTGVTIVTLTPGSERTLSAALKAEVQKANDQGRVPFVELGAEWCIPCQEIKALLDPPVDSKIADIFAGTYVIRLDVDKWDDGEQRTLGLVSPHGIPAFFAIDKNGAATAIMAGDEWGENTADGLQPLKQFFRRHRHDPREPQIRDSSSTIRVAAYYYEAPSATGPITGARRDTVATDTITSPISADLLTQWIALHVALAGLPDSVRVAAPTHQVASFGGKGAAEQFMIPLQDFGALATTHPSVAAAFTRAGILPHDYVALASQFVRPLLIKHMRELLADKIAGQTLPAGWPHTPPDTTLEHNVTLVGPAESRLAAAGFVLQLPPDELENSGQGIGDHMPDLTAIHWVNPTKDRAASGPVQFGDGHVYVLDFSAPWCALCPATYGPVSTVAARYAGKNVRTYVVTSGDTSELQAYFRRHNVSLPVLVEPSAASNPAMIQEWERLNLQVLPTILIVDAKGVVRYRVTGTNGNERALASVLAAGIDTLLMEQRGGASGRSRAIDTVSTPIPSAAVITVPFDDVQGLAMVNAEVDGHRGRFVLDIATPVVLLNRAHLQPNAEGTLDTVRVWPDSSAILAARTGKGLNWSPAQVSIRLGDRTIRVKESFVPTLGMIGMQYDLLPVEQYLDTQFLGLLGIPAVVDYETIIDFTRHRLTLVPVDSAGERLAPAPDYTPRSSVPILFSLRTFHWNVVGSLGGLPDTLVLDTGNNRNELNAKTQSKIATHVKATGRAKLQDGVQEPEVILDTLTVGGRTYTDVPFYVSDAKIGRDDTLGNSFFSSFGVIGFNMRAKRMIFYK